MFCVLPGKSCIQSKQMKLCTSISLFLLTLKALYRLWLLFPSLPSFVCFGNQLTNLSLFCVSVSKIPLRPCWCSRAVIYFLIHTFQRLQIFLHTPACVCLLLGHLNMQFAQKSRCLHTCLSIVCSLFN